MQLLHEKKIPHPPESRNSPFNFQKRWPYFTSSFVMIQRFYRSQYQKVVMRTNKKHDVIESYVINMLNSKEWL